MKPKYLLILFALGLGLALVWVLGGVSTPAVAAPRAEGHIEALSVPAAEGSTELAKVLHVCFGGCLYSSIQDAVDAANEGDVIKVTAGTYIDVHGRPAPAGYDGPSVITQVLYISKTVTIRGGYTTAFTDPPDPEANPTTLDAQGQGRVLLIAGSISTTIEGLRITGGDAAGLGGLFWEDETYTAGGGVFAITATVTFSDNYVFSNTAVGDWSVGGGLWLMNSDATLSGNTIANNTTNGGGGGLHLGWSNATVSGNTFSANTALQGGGLQVSLSDATVSENTFSDNTATVGGGLFLWDGTITLSGNTISANTADWGGGLQLLYCNDTTVSGNIIINNTAVAERGGGLRLYDSDNVTVSGNIISGNTARIGGGVDLTISDATLINNIVADNRARVAGSALYIYYSSPRLLHATIARNSGGDGSGVFVSYSSAVDLINTVLVGHSVGIYVASGSSAELDATLWGSGTWANGTDRRGPGTINHSNDHPGDPAFVDADNGDYHIALASAAIDAGVDAGVTTDIDGDPRPAGMGFDIGADEHDYPALEVVKGAYPDPVQPGAPLTYTIHVTNVGNVDLHATITDTLPLSVTLDQASGGTSALPGGTLAPPDGTVVLPDGRVAVTWTAVITAPGGLWMGTIVVRVDEGYGGPLTNLVEVTTEEGAAGDDSVTVIASRRVYLPLVMRDA